jgi:hypothetical protein
MWVEQSFSPMYAWFPHLALGDEFWARVHEHNHHISEHYYIPNINYT